VDQALGLPGVSNFENPLDSDLGCMGFGGALDPGHQQRGSATVLHLPLAPGGYSLQSMPPA